MKKNLLILLFAAFAFTFVACSKSNGSLINDYRNVCEKIVEAGKKGDLVKIASLAQDAAKIEKELGERELTAEEEAEISKIAMEIFSSMSSGESNMFDSLEGLFN